MLVGTHHSKFIQGEGGKFFLLLLFVKIEKIQYNYLFRLGWKHFYLFTQQRISKTHKWKKKKNTLRMKTNFLCKISSWRVRTRLNISELFIGCNASSIPKASTVIRDMLTKVIHSIHSFLLFLIKKKNKKWKTKTKKKAFSVTVLKSYW